MRHQHFQKVGRRPEIRIEDSEKTRATLQDPCREGARLVTGPVRPPQVVTTRRVLRVRSHPFLDQRRRVVGRIVEDLDLDPVPGQRSAVTQSSRPAMTSGSLYTGHCTQTMGKGPSQSGTAGAFPRQ